MYHHHHHQYSHQGWSGDHPRQQSWQQPPPSYQYPYSPTGQYQPPPGPPPTSHYSPPPGPPPSHYYPPGSYPTPSPSPYGQPHTSTPPPQSSSPYPRSYHNHSPSWNQNLPPRPPQEAQHFGGGAPSNYRFQYSNCTGRRKALLIGINYIGQPNQLRGCINDVTNMSTFLNQKYGYRREDMVILTDDQTNPMSIPNKANILRAMQWLVKDAQPNDSLFIHFSGHGGRTPDLDGDEEDGYDDVIYPLDYRTAGHIVDDDMHAIMVRPLRPGVRLTAIFDSCHSGTALDLPYVYSTQGVLKEPNLAKEAAMDLFSAINSYGKGDLSSVAQTAIGFFKKAANGDTARQRTVMTKTSPADVVMFSGSKDTQTSADTFQDGEARGALSWAFIKTLQQRPNQSYLVLLNSIRSELEGKYTQKPQLSCSHPLDTNLLFVM
ncbi:caspase family protein [Aspergillus ibericus CBS 121593]|uniref:Metacaspase-1B n=1 Tax=Aspergillus ibericus CBS 121593 TaxID=1448316 RepID=A0A395H6G0_9EURO|nr:hypothetical protein BO80DRAFT_424212 [Aspergillus ibericus CBS 121593]RAL01844.1 hypothetical protein BO80DRAFT_424212 [Aspergillus ibericus CBS 121593]